MPPKIYNASLLRAHFKQAPVSRSKQNKEEMLRAMYLRFESVKTFIERNGHGGKIILPLPPALTNGFLKSCHWAYKNEIKDAYKNHCQALLWAKLLPMPPSSPPMKVRGVVTLYSSREHDLDGMNARRKWAQDFLTEVGYIRDDAPQYFDVQAKAVTVPRCDVRLEFELED